MAGLQARQLASAQGGAGATWLPRSTRGPCAQPLRSHRLAALPVRSPRSQTTGRPTPRRDNTAGAAAPLTPRHSPHARAAAARSSSAALRAAVLRVRRAPACAAPGASAARPVALRPRGPGQRRRRGAGMVVAAPGPLLGCRRSARSSPGRCRAPAPGRRAGASEIPERGRRGSRRLCAPTLTVRGRDPSRQAAPARLGSAGPRVSAPPRPRFCALFNAVAQVQPIIQMD